jgi:hypothetical protein
MPNHVDELTAQGRLILFLGLMAEEERPCRFCGEHLYFLRSPKIGRRIALNKQGVDHEGRCPNTRDL